MYRKDYFLRVVEEFVEWLSKVLKLKNQGRYQEALEEIDKAYQGYFGWDASFCLQLPDNFLVETLQKNYQLHAEQMKIIADLIQQQGEIYFAQTQWEESYDLLYKALTIQEFLNSEEQTVFSFERHQKIYYLKAMINDLENMEV